MERTHRWAERSVRAKSRPDQALFGIVQGGVDPGLRVASAEFISSLRTPGIAIGGLSVGETKPEMHQVLDVLGDVLPANQPRYLMGVGTPKTSCRALRAAWTSSIVCCRRGWPDITPCSRRRVASTS